MRSARPRRSRSASRSEPQRRRRWRRRHERLPVGAAAAQHNHGVRTAAGPETSSSELTAALPQGVVAQRAARTVAAPTEARSDTAAAAPRRIAASAPEADALGRTLARAVAVRAADRGAASPEPPAVLARARTKGTTARRRAAAPTRRKAAGRGKAAAGKGVRKPRKTQPPAPPAAFAAVAGPRRSGRVRVRPGELDRQIHWGDPVFGAWTARDGGTSVSADLGPAAGQPVNYGSVPTPGQCTSVEWLNATAYAGHIWIKGHLLNDNLGGLGISRNLTPMTHTANMRYKTFEASVKHAIDACYHHGQFQDQTVWYGVRVAISVIGRQWPHAAQPQVRAVADHVSTTADYIAKIGPAAPVVIAQPAWAPALAPGDYDCVA